LVHQAPHSRARRWGVIGRGPVPGQTEQMIAFEVRQAQRPS
jgi:hypothetical protein